MNAPDWITTHDGTGDDAYAITCQRCGVIQRFETPLPLQYWLDVGKAFTRERRRCKDPGGTDTPDSLRGG